jgi:kynurenine formamidase
VRAKCAANPIYEVTADDLVAWEREHGRQLVDVIVLLRTGWATRWGDRAAYLGTGVKGPEAVPLLRFPGLAPEAAKWLVEHRRVKAVGIDVERIHSEARHFKVNHRLVSNLCKVAQAAKQGIGNTRGSPTASGDFNSGIGLDSDV